MTTINGLFITDVCEDNIAVSNDVQTEMQRLRTEGQLPLSLKPIYEAPNNSIKICFLNACSLHKHIDDIRHDLNYLSTDVNIFTDKVFSTR